MKSHYFSNRLGRILLSLSFLVAIGVASSAVAQAQWPRESRDRRERNRDYRRDRDRNDSYSRNRDYRGNDQYGRNGGYGNGGYGGYGNVSQAAVNQGFQDGLYTGSNDARRGQSYNPQRSHFYHNGHGDNGNYGGYNNSYQFQQAYRNGFLRGYDQGFQRYGGYNNNRRSNGSYGRFPFPW